jgi:hypothetical protein
MELLKHKGEETKKEGPGKGVLFLKRDVIKPWVGM